MKKTKKMLVVILLLIIGICLMLFIKKNFVETKEEFKWQAKYIWLPSNEFKESDFVEGVDLEKMASEEGDKKIKLTSNTWTCFRKKINIENKSDIKDVVAKIAVDSKYWLYINDEMVIREGGLKRGQKVDSIYYDEVNLDNYLKEGENTIAILVWYFGKTSYSHIDSGKGALLFQANIGDQTIISDESWKTIKNPAYLKDIPIDTDRLSESNIYYDANLAIDDWYKSEYDDSTWENAKTYGNAGDFPWGELIARNIPQFKNAEIKEYKNFEKYRDYVSETDTLLELEVPYNIQLTTYLKVDAKANSKIIITTDSNYDEEGKYQKCTYITRDGVQEFESLAWINGEKIYYYIPAGVKVISLGYRETGYDTEVVGSFTSNDEFFNKLWDMSSRTLYINMRDSYMDCPDRERAQWWGDASVAVEQALYALDSNANKLYEKGVKTLFGWNFENILMTIAPKVNMHLPVQMLLGIDTMYDYYEYTGKEEFLQYIYPYLEDYLNLWEIRENGLAYLTNHYLLWPWGDSAGECDYTAIENICYYYALTRLYDMAEVLEYTEELPELKRKIDLLYNGINNEFWKENGYNADGLERFDVRANAIAILSGLASEDKHEEISKILIKNYDNSTMMEKYVLEALCELGKIEETQDRIKNRYSEMVEKEEEFSSTLWEYWDPNYGSKNHTWTGGPLTIMAKYFAGIKPLKPGYEEITIKPNFGNLNKIETTVNTAKGNVNLKAEKTEENIVLDITVPTKTLVAVEKCSESPTMKVNGKTICKDGKIKNNFNTDYYSHDEEYVYFYINEGTYVFESK